MATTRLSRTVGTPTLNTKYTLSFWLKRSKLSYSEPFVFDGRADASNRFKFAFQSTDKIECWNSHNGSNTFQILTNRVFRDVNSWYHFVLAVDTTQGTDTNRVKLYVNGVQETSLATNNSPSINEANNVFNESGAGISVGAYYNNTYGFDGLLSHVHFCDGQQLAPTVFGSTDSTTGEWKINTSPSFTLGNNGFTILKDGNTITDQSSNSNDFSLANGTLTKTEDCPSNVFCTFNPLLGLTGAVFFQGNTYFYRSSGGNNRTIPGTIGASSGKYYAEFKVGALMYAGVLPINGSDVEKTQIGTNNHLGQHSGGYSLGTGQNGAVTYNGGSLTASGYTWSGTEIIQRALDLDNSKVFIGKNNVWANSSNPENNTGGYSIQSGLTYTFGCTNSNADTACNFGNGHFQSTAISSAGTNASGNGVFELNVPAGYTALSTKGLNL